MDDPEELRGVKEGLRIRSELGAALEVGSRRRGMIMVASLKPDFFTERDESFVQSAAQWIGLVAHRSELLADIERNALEQGRRSSAEELVTILAHDLRNYLAPVLLRLYTLRHRAETENRRADIDDANVALRGLSQAKTLISDLLDVARLDEGVFKIETEPVDMVALVREAGGVLTTGEHEVVVKASAPVVVAADPARIRQCVDNLLTNAIGHSPKGGSISVFITQEQSETTAWGCVEVVDEGPGIPDDLLPHIFDRFLTGRAREGGVGLGLYIAKRIAAVHGGDVRADRYPGKGARFTLRIPLFD